MQAKEIVCLCFAQAEIIVKAKSRFLNASTGIARSGLMAHTLAPEDRTVQNGSQDILLTKAWPSFRSRLLAPLILLGELHIAKQTPMTKQLEPGMRTFSDNIPINNPILAVRSAKGHMPSQVRHGYNQWTKAAPK